MPYALHTAWPPKATDGCLIGLSHREQVENATFVTLTVRGDPQSGFLKCLFEAMLAKTEVEYGCFLVGTGWQSSYLICPTNALKSYQILLAAMDKILLR